MVKINIKNDLGYYIPMFNERGFKSYITPRLLGDIKVDYHSYLLEPTTEKDLSESFFSRHVVFHVDDKKYYSNGTSEHQTNDTIDLETGLLYQKVTRKNKYHEIEITTFVPKNDMVEANKIVYNNITKEIQQLRVVVATPIYARSADNLRDHRHVTSLLNDIEVIKNGVIVKPTLSFDERGHKVNDKHYAVYASSSQIEVEGYCPSLQEYINEGSIRIPKGDRNYYKEADKLVGVEALGGIAFKTIEVKPKEQITFLYNLGINEDKEELLTTLNKYNNEVTFKSEFNYMIKDFKTKVEKLQFQIEDKQRSYQVSQIPIQPILRRFMGNSYLPHHDYGKGGRGWRDLWQDLISMIIYADERVESLLLNNFSGIRIDGSNATIIGDKPGVFMADRNNIVRVWSDHGAWPLLTTKMYIDETGNIDFLFKETSYFDDQFTHYTKKMKSNFSKDHVLKQKGITFEGTVLEHLLLQNVVACHNTGDKGFIRIEDADWNDGHDMASEKGETIAFTHFYANNLRVLAKLIESISVEEVKILEPLINLMINKDYSLINFFDDVSSVDLKSKYICKDTITKALNEKSNTMITHLEQEGINSNLTLQSYVDNSGCYFDSHETVSLTGQAMALLNKTVSIKQAESIVRITKKHLFEQDIGGYRLNSNHDQVKMNMGRAYGFAYGTKENGAVFSHMSLMYAYGLYQYGYVDEGSEAYKAILDASAKIKSKVLIGIPEYFDNDGVGKYMFLTGSATWLLKLLRTEVFGIKFNMGKLTLDPKLLKSDFIDGTASINTYLFGKLRTVKYYNAKNLDYGKYKINKIYCNNIEVKNDFICLNGDLEVHLNENN